MRKTYDGIPELEFKYISNQEKVNWLTNEMEKKFTDALPLDKKRRILEKLNQESCLKNSSIQNMWDRRDFPWKEGKRQLLRWMRSSIRPPTMMCRKWWSVWPIAEDWMCWPISWEKPMNRSSVSLRGRQNWIRRWVAATWNIIWVIGSEPRAPDNKTVHLKLMPNPSHLGSGGHRGCSWVCEGQGRCDVPKRVW